MNYLFRLTSFSALFFIFTSCTNADHGAPTDYFFNRYQLASDIVYGEVVSTEKTKDPLPIFEEFSASDNYKAVLKVAKSWKGKKEGEIAFYYNYTGTSPWIWDGMREAKHIYPVSVGRKFLLFLREDGGKKIAQSYFGAIPIQDEDILVKLRDVTALEDLRAGKKMAEVVNRFGPREVRAFEEANGK